MVVAEVDEFVLHYQKECEGFMNRIGIIAAMKPELDILRDELLNSTTVKHCGCVFYCGTIGNCDVVLSECGVGKVNSSMAATLMISYFECNLLINTGIAGAVGGLKTKDVVIASKLMYHDFDTTIFGYQYGQVPAMPLEFTPNIESVVMIKKVLNKLWISYNYCPVYSGDQFVSKREQLTKINPEIPSACEMEGASIAQVAVKSGVDFIVLRYLSDVVGEENQVEDYLSFESEMAERSSKICSAILNNL